MIPQSTEQQDPETRPAVETPPEALLAVEMERLMRLAGASGVSLRFDDRPDLVAGRHPQPDAEPVPAPRPEGDGYGDGPNLALLIDTIPHIAWAADPNGGITFMNARFRDYLGGDPREGYGAHWQAMIHPDDRAVTAAAWSAALSAGTDHFIEHRIRTRDGSYRWFASRGIPVRDAAGTVVAWYGTATDIEDEKRTAEAVALLSRELVHRIKNIFAVVSSLVRFTFRGNAAARDGVEVLQERLAALSRAHDSVRPQTASNRPEAELQALVRALLSPYRGPGDDRLTVSGDDIAIGPRTAASLALVLHEQATNAVKYGALSAPAGRVAVTVAVDADSIRLTWTETGGPAVAGPPTRRGFGTDLAARSVADQLSGQMVYDWRPEGLALEIHVPRSATLG